jgi:hypothetical protein
LINVASSLGSITCPSCGDVIALDEVYAHELREKVEAESRRVAAEKDAEFGARMDAALDEKEAELTKRAEERVATRLADLGAAVEEKDTLLTEARGELLDLHREKREFEEQKKSFELDKARQLDDERVAITAKAREEVAAEHQLEIRGRDLQLDQMRQKFEALEQASKHTKPGFHGDVLVRDVEDLLRERFPHDQIDVVKTGIKGPDIVHTVMSQRGLECGKIAWEFKRAKTWNNAWIPKLKDDQRDEGADLSVIVTTVLPADVSSIDLRDGVWIVHHSHATGLALALRERLIALAHERVIELGRNQVGDLLYEHVSSERFAERILSSAKTLVDMQKELTTERAAFAKIWSKRETEIERLFSNLGGIYGGLQGIMGAALRPVEPLELPDAVIELPSLEPPEEASAA